jgi:GT2 family glycosyltransferase
MTSSPSITVLVLNRSGRDDLGACLSSLDAQEFTGSRPIIEVLDAGSSDGTSEFVRQRFPRISVLDLKGNLGFAQAYNIAVNRAQTERVALLSAETRVDRRWLEELVATADRSEASIVASKILDWTGERVEFAGGSLSFIGQPSPRHFGEPADTAYESTDLLYACGDSLLIARDAFLEAGGFDETFFTSLEDVDFGWRLNLLGHRTVLAPGAITFRRPQLETEWQLTAAARTRLFERNALALIFSNYSDETLRRILPVAVGLSLLRGLIGSGIDTLKLDFSVARGTAAAVENGLLAHLIALEDFCGQLPALSDRRQAIQETRKRADAELFPLFGDPLHLSSDRGERYEQIAQALTRDFGIDEMITRGALFPPAERVALRVALPRETDPMALAARPNPRVSVVILTALGALHLQECLGSLRAQNYPLDLCEVIIVDNGSPTPVGREVEEWYPNVRVIASAENLGFARGNNLGAQSAGGQYIIFLNDDTRVHPDWIYELVSTARRRNAAAVAACMLDWEGKSLDFAGGGVNFQGKGFQSNYGEGPERFPTDEQRLLFACGGAMLVDRAVLTHAGGWDDDAFAYYEDVELGWRLNMLGYQVWLSPRAVVYHKHHGTSGKWAEAPRTRLYERNSLRMVYALLETESLAHTLPAALLLTADRAMLACGLARATGPISAAGLRLPFHVRVFAALKRPLLIRGVNRQTSIAGAFRKLGLRGCAGVIRDFLILPWRGLSKASGVLVRRRVESTSPLRTSEEIPIHGAAILSGLFGFLDDLPALSLRRQELQKRRAVSDVELLKTFGHEWTMASGSVRPAEHHQRHRDLVEQFGVAELAGRHAGNSETAEGKLQSLNTRRTPAPAANGSR